MAIVNSAAMNVRVDECFWIGVSEFSGMFPTVESPGQKAVPF